MAITDAELIRNMINVLQESHVPATSIDEAVATGVLQRLRKYSKSFLPGGGGQGQREVQVAGYSYAKIWQKFMQREGTTYKDVDWQDLRRFLSSPNIARSLKLSDDLMGSPLNIQEIQSIVADKRVRNAIAKEIDTARAGDNTHAPLDKILPATGNITSLMNVEIGGAPVGADDQTSQDTRAKRAEIIVLAILEAAVVLMFRKAQEMEPSSTPAAQPPATAAAQPATQPPSTQAAAPAAAQPAASAPPVALAQQVSTLARSGVPAGQLNAILNIMGGI